jgi:flagellar hook-associated protein 1 FlgK
VTFSLKPEQNQVATDDYAQSAVNQDVICGETVDTMGIPYYQAQINEFLRNFTEAFNKIEKEGKTLEDEDMGAFFIGVPENKSENEVIDAWNAADLETQTTGTISSGGISYYTMTANNICVNSQSLKDANYFATASEITNGDAKYDIVEKLLDLQNQADMFRGDNAETFLETLLSDITVDVNKTEISSNNYANLATVIGNQRTSVAGVDEDEEALNLIKFQNAYNLASKVISVMAEMYDKLINETGVT